MNSGFVASRALGAFPLSIATSIAFEHLFGIKSEANPEPKPNSIKKYSQFWINLKTLYRNMAGSISRDHNQKVSAHELSDYIILEMETIVRLVNEYSNGTCAPIFFVSNYDFGFYKYANATLRADSTDNQKAFTQRYKETIKHVLKHGPIQGSELLIFANKLKPAKKEKSIILTHIAYDLANSEAFGGLDLIESHTGAIKGKDLWYTKYYDGKELPFIPFIDILLPVFGDSEVFKPMLKSAREDIIAVAKRYNWSSVTTREKVMFGLNTLKNQYLIDVIKTFR